MKNKKDKKTEEKYEVVKEDTAEIWFDPVFEQFTRPAHPETFGERPGPRRNGPQPMPDDWYLENEAYKEHQRELHRDDES